MSGTGNINLRNALLPSDLWSSSSEPLKSNRIASTHIPMRPVIDINKKFLVNTIQSVESHNRFEEVQACWRQKDLDDKNHKRRRHDNDRNRDVKEEQDIERQKWAEKKAESQAVRELLPDVTYNSSSSSGRGGINAFEAPPSHGPAGERSAAAFIIYSSDDDSSHDSERESHKKRHKKDKKSKKESKKEKKNEKKKHNKKEMKFSVKLKTETEERLKQVS